MTIADANPFPSGDPDRRAIWQMLVTRDTDAYLEENWAMVAEDFIAEGFFGIDAQRRTDSGEWRMAFPNLEAYRHEWLRQAALTASRVDRTAARAAMLAAVTLANIELAGDFAIAHKNFNGSLPNLDGSHEPLLWQTIYVCRRQEQRWKITSFVGYMPYVSGGAAIGQGRGSER